MILHIRLWQDDSGYPPFAAEEVEARNAGDYQFQLETVPSFAFGLAMGDVVQARPYGADLWVEELIEGSGHSTIRVAALGAHSVETPRAKLQELGCSTFETAIEGMIAVDVPPTANFDTIRTYLVNGRATGTWDFNIGVRADGGSDIDS